MPFSFWRRWLWVLLLWPVLALGEARTALVVGNAGYRDSPLNGARDMAEVRNPTPLRNRYFVLKLNLSVVDPQWRPSSDPAFPVPSSQYPDQGNFRA